MKARFARWLVTGVAGFWIGPRPKAEVLSRYFEGEIPFYRYRHVVSPASRAGLR